MKKFISALMPLMLLCSCAKTSNTTNNSNSNSCNAIVINLTLDNYWKYFDVDDTKMVSKYPYSQSLSFSMKGLLSYAFYEDVVVYFKVTSYYTTYETLKLELNANGNGSIKPIQCNTEEFKGNRNEDIELVLTSIDGNVIIL